MSWSFGWSVPNPTPITLFPIARTRPRPPRRPPRRHPQRARPLRALTFDVEEYFHIEAAHGVIHKTDWPHWPNRARLSVHRLLGWLDHHNRQATFFILADVAKKHPRLAPLIADAGHEVASHGFMHDRIHRLDRTAFKKDVEPAKKLLEDQTGLPVLGYRAPSFSLTPKTAWALDVLIEQGFQYDASIFPVRHPRYGVPEAPRGPFYVRADLSGQKMLEIPPLTWRRMPVAGGAYFRFFPLACVRRGVASAARAGNPAVLYFHPWEFDPLIPRMPLAPLQKLRTYGGIGASVGKLHQLLQMPCDDRPLAQMLDRCRRQADAAPVLTLAPEGQTTPRLDRNDLDAEAEAIEEKSAARECATAPVGEPEVADARPRRHAA